MSALARPLVALLALACATGCGADLTSSSAWVHEPESGGSLGDTELALERHGGAAYTSEAAPKTGPRRLAHTITLGSVVDSGRGPAPAAAAPGPPAVTIQVNNHVAPATYGLSEVPAFVTTPSGPASTARGTGSAGVQPGQNFPAPVSYGPAFPFQSNPASPWETRR
jgi:hypothetical protein